MPKVKGTKKQEARELLRLLEDGPCLDYDDSRCEKYTPEMAMESVHRWINSWIIHKVKHLVPELKEKSKESEKCLGL